MQLLTQSGGDLVSGRRSGHDRRSCSAVMIKDPAGSPTMIGGSGPGGSCQQIQQPAAGADRFQVDQVRGLIVQCAQVCSVGFVQYSVLCSGLSDAIMVSETRKAPAAKQKMNKSRRMFKC